MNDEFSPEERARARTYHRPLYLALLVDVALAAGLLAALAWSSLGDWLFSPLSSLSPVAAAAAYAALVTVFSSLVRTPLACWRGWWRERKWGFSTQGAGGWLADRAKGLAVSVVIPAGPLVAGIMWFTGGKRGLRQTGVAGRPFWAGAPKPPPPWGPTPPGWTPPAPPPAGWGPQPPA